MANGLAEELAELVDRAQDLMDQAGQVLQYSATN